MRDPSPKSCTPRCFLAAVIYASFLSFLLSYIITPFSRGANRISSSLETRQGVKVHVTRGCAVRVWGRWRGPVQRKRGRKAREGGNRRMACTQARRRGLPRKGDDPLGVPRNSTSWYRGDVLPHTNKHTQTISLSHISRFPSFSDLVFGSLFFFAPSFSLDLSPCSFVYLSFYLFRGWVVVRTRGQTEKKEEKKEEELAKIQTCWNVEHSRPSRCPFGDSLSSARTHVSVTKRKKDTTVCPAIFIDGNRTYLCADCANCKD